MSDARQLLDAGVRRHPDSIPLREALVQTLYAPKTDSTRIVPITTDLFDILQETFDAAAEGTVNVVLLSPRRSNLHRGLETIIKRAGLVAWPRAWHNLRSSRQTELTETFPSHVVTAWLGNSERIAEKHYLQVLDSHFDRASALNSAAPALRNTSETLSTAPQPCSAANAKPLVLSGKPTKQGVCVNGLMGDTGFEPVTSTV